MLDGARDHPIVATAVGVQERVRDIEGAPLASAVTLTFFLTLFPVLLVAVAVLGFIAVDVAPLPKSQLYPVIVPSESEESWPRKATASGTVPDVGVALARAVGAWRPVMPTSVPVMM